MIASLPPSVHGDARTGLRQGHNTGARVRRVALAAAAVGAATVSAFWLTAELVFRVTGAVLRRKETWRA